MAHAATPMAANAMTSESSATQRAPPPVEVAGGFAWD